MKASLLIVCLVMAESSISAVLNRTLALSDGQRPVCLSSAGAIVIPQESRDPDKTWREIKSLVQSELGSESIAFNKPSFTMVRVGSSVQLKIHKGGVGDIGFGNDPYKTPFTEQMLIELMRHALANAHFDEIGKLSGRHMINDPLNSDQQWQCHLEQAEQLVRQAVLIIQTVSNKNELNQLLLKIEAQIDDLLYTKLFASIEEYANLNKLNVIFERGDEAPKPFSVSIRTTPTGARVWILKGLRYQQLLKLTNIEAAQWPWEELVQNPALLIGKYRYRARWPDGQFTEGDINVSSPNPINLQQ